MDRQNLSASTCNTTHPSSLNGWREPNHPKDGSMPPTPQNALVWTVRETADNLRLSTRKIEYLIAAGDLESVKLGRSRRVLVASVHAYLQRSSAA